MQAVPYSGAKRLPFSDRLVYVLDEGGPRRPRTVRCYELAWSRQQPRLRRGVRPGVRLGPAPSEVLGDQDLDAHPRGEGHHATHVGTGTVRPVSHPIYGRTNGTAESSDIFISRNRRVGYFRFRPGSVTFGSVTTPKPPRNDTAPDGHPPVSPPPVTDLDPIRNRPSRLPIAVSLVSRALPSARLSQ